MEKSKVSRPILIFYITLSTLDEEESQKYMQNFATHLRQEIPSDEYILILLATREESHRVEMLSPNNKVNQKKLMDKLEEIKIHVEKFENLEEK